MLTPKTINHFFGILGYILLGIILSGETARYLFAHDSIWQPFGANYLLWAFLLVFWFGLAIVLQEIGFLYRCIFITHAGFILLTLAVTAMIFIGFPYRCQYQEAFNNPFTIILLAESLGLLILGGQSKFVKDYLQILGGFGIIGLFSLFAILTIEWFNYIEPLAGDSPALRSITLLWALYTFGWLALGFVIRSLPLRVCGLIILFTTLLKTTLFDSTVSFGYCSWLWNTGQDFSHWFPLANPYFLTMLVPVIPTLVLAAWTNRSQLSFVSEQERVTWNTAGVFGLITLLVYLSIECYQFADGFELGEKRILGKASLTILWTLAALTLTMLALAYQSRMLRIISMTLFCFSLGKVLLLDLAFRPDYVNGVPMLNFYFLPMLFLVVTVMIGGYLWTCRLVGELETPERNFYRFIAFFGVFFLWLTMSVECFQSIQHQTASQEAWKAQMALSILWSLFAGALIVVGFIWRSSVLRWKAIVLFALTILKVLMVDMSGVHELYRFGAVFVLALFLAFAAWVYQRFRPDGMS